MKRGTVVRHRFNGEIGVVVGNHGASDKYLRIQWDNPAYHEARGSWGMANGACPYSPSVLEPISIAACYNMGKYTLIERDGKLIYAPHEV
jgi:hypothetical protein